MTSPIQKSTSMNMKSNNNDDKSSKLKNNIKTNDTTELLKTIPNQEFHNKFDDIIDTVIKVDNTCYFTKCKQKTNLMGVDCQFCKNKFCFKHGLPEVHGCGDAVKIDERKKFLHPIPEKTKREQADLKKAQKTLNAKLKDMQISRLPKSKKSNKNQISGNNRQNDQAGTSSGAADGKK